MNQRDRWTLRTRRDYEKGWLHGRNTRGTHTQQSPLHRSRERERERMSRQDRSSQLIRHPTDGRSRRGRSIGRLLHAGGQFLHQTQTQHVDRASQRLQNRIGVGTWETHHRFPAFLCQLPVCHAISPGQFPSPCSARSRARTSLTRNPVPNRETEHACIRDQGD